MSSSSPENQEEGRGGKNVISVTLERLWKLLPENVRLNLGDTFQPEDVDARRIPGEEIQLVIRMAWYRGLLGHYMFEHMGQFFGLFILLTVIVGGATILSGINIYYVLIPVLLFVAIFLFGLYERLEYYQWRLLKTNARLVISIPQKGAWPLVDNIELKGAPAIIDTNWSPSPVWRVFQFFTGARDLYISMSGLQFVEGKAKVRDALRIPDIMPDDVFELKKLVFIPK